MSINYCTIGTNTVDGFCGTQRAKVLALLLAEKYDNVQPPAPSPAPPPGGGGGGISYGPSTPILPGTTISPGWPPNQNVPIYRPYDSRPDIDQNVPPIEQPFITVTVELYGKVGSETQEMSARLDFVVVTDLEINSETAVSVNISEMEIKHA